MFVNWVCELSAILWNGINQLGNMIFDITTSTTELSFSTIGRVFNLYFSTSNNPFLAYFNDCGYGIDHLTYLFSTLVSGVNAIVGTITTFVSLLISKLSGFQFTGNLFLLIVYFLVGFGFVFLILFIASRLVRVVKDLLNPIN